MSDSSAPAQRAASGAAHASAPQARGESGTPRVVRSDTLLGGQSQLAILHNETVYFLRQTRFGKLILTK